LVSSIETEISKVEAELTKTQAKVDALSAQLLELQKLSNSRKQLMEERKDCKP
jgi:Skp family chaperone for outer membrane proteins